MTDHGDQDERERARALFRRFLPRAMQDGVLDPVEQRQLLGILTSGVLSKEDVQTVFREYLAGVYGEVAADGVLTEQERARCRAIVAELRIPHGFLPPELAEIVA